jgi:acetyl esterase/lipase
MFAFATAAGVAAFLFLMLLAAALARAGEPITRPVVSEEACPLVAIAPVARDGHRGQGFLRKPPGAGPFPAVVWIHGGLRTVPADALKNMALTSANPSRFLAAGYVVAVITYRSRDHDPQSTVALEDCLAAIEHLRRLPAVDPKSIVVFGCSGGGDLALEIAAATDICAIAPEEPASVLFTGIFNAKFPKKGERHTPLDAAPIAAEPKRYYTAEYQKLTREKIGRIRCPILIVQGDQHPINRFNAEVLIPELRTARKTLDVLTYPGEPHCFAFSGNQRPAAALKAFQDTDAFYRRHLPTKPKPLDPSLVKPVPLAGGPSAGPAVTADKKTQTIEGWGTVTDPDGNCTVKAEKGKLTVTVPGALYDLHPGRGMNAPRVLREVEGDFTATVKVAGEFKPGEKVAPGANTAGNYAGLLLWEGDKNYLRLERNARWAGGQLVCFAPGFEYWKDGQIREGSPRTTTADFFAGKSTWLKLERAGNNVTASYSHDGKEWTEAKKVPVEFPRKVQIGVAAVNSSDAPFTVEFEEFRVVAGR